jgi:hypothetical protein
MDGECLRLLGDVHPADKAGVIEPAVMGDLAPTELAATIVEHDRYQWDVLIATVGARGLGLARSRARFPGVFGAMQPARGVGDYVLACRR